MLGMVRLYMLRTNLATMPSLSLTGDGGHCPLAD